MDDKSELEIVFVSSDSDEESFLDYFGSQPWTAIPFSNRDGAQALGSKFGIRSIPSFIVLNASGNTLDKDGRSTVTSSKGNVDKAFTVWKV